MIRALCLTAAATGWAITSIHALRLHQKLRTDSLTGLANRTALRDVFDRRRVLPEQCVAVLMLDLNGFKYINDTYGHHFGDRVLVEVSRRLRRFEQEGHFAIRLSGDEFAFWLGTFPDAPEEWVRIETLRRNITESIAELMVIDGQPIQVTVSVGAAVTLAKVDTLEQLLAHADREMYRDKARHTSHRRQEVA